MIEFDSEQYIADLQQAMKVLLEEAAREWLRAVAIRVPVWSGEARSSLLPLSRYLDEELQVHVAQNAPDRRALGETESRYEFHYEEGQMEFRFSTLVPHYLINDFNMGLGQPPLIHPTPWHSLAAGEAAFKEYLRVTIPQAFPKRLAKYFKIK